MKVNIETIPHSRQRYETCGDYWIDKKGTIQIRISKMGSDIAEKMVMIHELVELVLCEWKMISIDDIDKFDKKFEAKRKKGDLSEPGFDPKAPYKNEHAIATAVELIMCAHLNISWKDYEEIINKL